MKRLFLIAIIILCFVSLCYALETDTHQAINEYIAQYTFNGFSLNSYLQNQLGIQKGTNEIVNSKKIYKRLGEGGVKEDIPYWYMPYLRSVNHFHNPLTKQGFSGYWGIGFLAGVSSMQWSQEPIGSQSPGGHYSWYDARDFFYNALTASDKPTRDQNFADTFRGLGQIMHLVEDSSVPEHTRADGHGPCWLSYNYECWTKKQITDKTLPNYPPIYFDLSAIGSPNPLASVPIANLFDTNQYNGANPNITTQNNIGLSEYANANFFSGSTIFKAGFPYPALSSVVEAPEIDAAGNLRIYLKKIGDGETMNHLAVGRLFYKYLSSDKKNRGLKLDDTVYADYAQNLIPRAVGYSAGLLNYFFRGQLEVITTPNGLKVRNVNSEEMDSFVDPVTGDRIGSISVYYDDTNNERNLLASYDLPAPLAPGEEIPAISFTSPSNNVRPGKYTIVFRGKLGTEEGAAIGKVTSPVQIYFVSTRSGVDKIYKMEIDGSNSTLVYDNQNPDLYIGRLAPSPDGNILLFAADLSADPTDSTIYQFDLTKGTLEVLTKGDWPNWSPDGKKIVFEKETGQYLPEADVEIFTIDPITGIETQLTNVPGSSFSSMPAWSPDGNVIAYTKFNEPMEEGCENLYSIYLMSSSGNPVGSLTCQSEGPYDDDAPSWSPDGREINFIRKRFAGQYYQLYKINIATQAITKLTDSSGTNYNEFPAAWSPDGRTIAIGSSKDGDFDIWMVDSNGGGYLTNLTNSNPSFDLFPTFGW
jgi:Tol biopolymer transport system component